MQTYLFVLPFIVLYLLRKYLVYRRTVHSIQDSPGFRTLFHQTNFLLPKRIRGITPGTHSAWLTKHQDFADFGSDIFSAVGGWSGDAAFFVADADALKEVSSSRTRFPKPLWLYKVLTFFGSNIVVTEGDEWKKHRKIAAPAFSERNSRLVWDESMNVMLDLFDNVWEDQEEIVTDNVVDLTVPIALFIIGIAGFGRRITWKEDISIPLGHVVAFKDALHLVSNSLWMKVLIPGWVLNWGPTQHVRDFKVAYDELERYMIEMIQARKKLEKRDERYDLFSSLLDANEEEGEGNLSKLSDSELIGNIFVFLIAGHETTAHTLAFTFTLLALYQDEQEILYKHVSSVMSGGKIPSYEEMGQFSYSLAVFYETLRLFPSVTGIPKYAAEDMTLPTRTTAGEFTRVPIPKGSEVTIHTPGLHYNPRYWEDPYAFKPARFLGDWPRDAFLPFSGGARSCLGRKFSETEGVAILSLLISRYKIGIKEEPEFLSETFAQRKERLLTSKSALTLYPVRAPLVFRRR